MPTPDFQPNSQEQQRPTRPTAASTADDQLLGNNRVPSINEELIRKALALYTADQISAYQNSPAGREKVLDLLETTINQGLKPLPEQIKNPLRLLIMLERMQPNQPAYRLLSDFLTKETKDFAVKFWAAPQEPPTSAKVLLGALSELDPDLAGKGKALLNILSASDPFQNGKQQIVAKLTALADTEGLPVALKLSSVHSAIKEVYPRPEDYRQAISAWQQRGVTGLVEFAARGSQIAPELSEATRSLQELYLKHADLIQELWIEPQVRTIYGSDL